MNVTMDWTLIEAAQQIVPVIRDYAEEAERECRLSKPVLEALTQAGLLRMFIPRSLGGLEVDPLTCARVIEEVSRADSVAGWTLFNPLGWAFFCARLPDAGAEEIFGQHPNAVIAGPFHPPMQATPVDGGYCVTGRSPFASNCRDATWVGSTVLVMGGDTPRLTASGEPEVRLAFFPSKACEIFDTWHVLGMRGTGSDDIAVHEVFVPEARTCLMLPEFTPGAHYQGPLYRLPAMGATAALFPAIVCAIARNAIDAVVALAQGKTPFGSTTVLRARASTQAKVAQAEGALRAARASGPRSPRRPTCCSPRRTPRAVRPRRWS
jgi:alkylation response protein AidB-like acyl-CoA dehydrogenase